MSKHGNIPIPNRLYMMKKNQRSTTEEEKAVFFGNQECPEIMEQITLVPREAILFQQYYDLLRSKLTAPPCKHQKELINSLLQAFMYEFHDTMERYIKVASPSYTSGEKLFNSFIAQLSSSYPKKRSVTYYADKLAVSPKYLSAICKEISEKTASELINQYVVKDIEYQLKRSRKSIKEIANELDFPNISFFGKYVKRYLGVSPKQYRAALD